MTDDHIGHQPGMTAIPVRETMDANDPGTRSGMSSECPVSFFATFKEQQIH
jgi:hypothetical protein